MDPVGEVVVGGDAGDFLVGEGEEGGGGELVGLVVGFREAFVGGEVGAVDGEFGGGAGGVVGGEDDDVF